MDWGAASGTAVPAPQRRLRRWVRRYALAELAGTSAALAAAVAVRGSAGAAAAAWAEAAAFYGVVLWRDLLAGAGPRATVRDAVVEFGPAEAVDSLLLRPLLLVACVGALGLVPGVVAGKIVADVLFYGLAIGSRTLLERSRA